MPVTLERAEEIIAAWRSGAEAVEGWDNPAGPLLTGGEYAESEITMVGPPRTNTCGTDCSGSRTRMCC
jgi:hypothetical protein